jgi:hypothetical protein
MRIGKGNWSTQRKPAAMPLWPPEILDDLTRDRTRAAAVGSWRLTIWAMTRPAVKLICLTSEMIRQLLFCKNNFNWEGELLVPRIRLGVSG